MSRRRLLFLFALLPQLGVLGLMIARAELTLRDGVLVELEVAAFDPIDLLSGRHVVTRLDVQTIDAGLVHGFEGAHLAFEDRPRDVHEGDVFFAMLDPADVPTRVVLVTPYEPETGRLFLRGTVTDVRRGPPSVDDVRDTELGCVSGLDADITSLRLDYGLERFFIPADGTDPSTWWDEDLARRPELRLLVRVRGGAATTEDLLVDGVPYAEWNATHRDG